MERLGASENATRCNPRPSGSDPRPRETHERSGGPKAAPSARRFGRGRGRAGRATPSGTSPPDPRARGAPTLATLAARRGPRARMLLPRANRATESLCWSTRSSTSAQAQTTRSGSASLKASVD